MVKLYCKIYKVFFFFIGKRNSFIDLSTTKKNNERFIPSKSFSIETIESIKFIYVSITYFFLK